MAVKSTKQIKKDNLDAHVEALSRELDEKTQKLHEIALREQAVKDDRAALDKEREQFKEERLEGTKTHNVIRSTTIHLKGTIDKNIEKSQEELKSLENKVRETGRQLVRLNNSCLNAQSDLDSTLRRKTLIEQDIAKLAELVIHFEEMKLKVKDIEERRDVLAKEVSNKQESHRIELSQMQTQVDTLSLQAIQKVEEARQAEMMYKMYSDKLRVSMNDFLVLRTRLETRWNEHYPDLKLPMTD